MEKTMSYKTTKGTEIEVVVSYSKVGNGFENDGYIVKSTKVSTCFEVRFLNGYKELASSFDINFYEKFDNVNYPEKSFKCDRLLLTTEEKEKVEKLIEQVISEYEIPAELAEIENAEKSVKVEKEEEIDEERTKKYNDLYNEGGEGYVPKFLKGEK